jgi:hypothetical protein
LACQQKEPGWLVPGAIRHQLQDLLPVEKLVPGREAQSILQNSDEVSEWGTAIAAGRREYNNAVERCESCDLSWSVWQEQFGVVKGGCLNTDTLVGEVLHELDNSSNPFRVVLQDWDTLDARGQILNICMEEVCTASVELHHFFKRLHPAIVHVGTSQLNISQRW